VPTVVENEPPALPPPRDPGSRAGAPPLRSQIAQRIAAHLEEMRNSQLAAVYDGRKFEDGKLVKEKTLKVAA